MDRREYLYQRRNRCVGRLLGELEQVVDPEVMDEVRRLVKTRMSEYHADVIEAMGLTSDTRFNALAMKARDRVGATSHHQD